MTHKLAVLVSGTGSLLEAMLKRGTPVLLVLADRPCRGIDEVPQGYKVKTELVARKGFGKSFDRVSYTKEVLEALHKHGITVIAMAGFMTIFSPEMFLPKERGGFEGAILNIHPSLLPSFKGDRAVQEALDFGAKVTGTTVHIATADLDEGPILAQMTVNIEEGDTKEVLHERIKKVERVLYPLTISKFMRELRD